MYLEGYFVTSYSIIFISLLEYSPGSMPESAHPPTPSATTKNCFDA